MKRNSRYALMTLLVCILFIGGIADAETVETLEKAKDDAKDAVDLEKARHDIATATLNQMIENFVTLHAHLAGIEISLTPALTPADLIVEFTKIVKALIKADLLTDGMSELLANIESQRDICDDIWADVVLLQADYELAIDAFNAAVSPEERITTVEVPQSGEVSNLYLCPGPCSTMFDTLLLATTSHKVFCSVPPHTTEFSYYSCPPIIRTSAAENRPIKRRVGVAAARSLQIISELAPGQMMPIAHNAMNGPLETSSISGQETASAPTTAAMDKRVRTAQMLKITSRPRS